MNNNLIVLEQLPVIKYRLEQLSVEIKEKLSKIEGLIVNEDTVKETKQLRAELNKEFNELETQRKTVKQAIMSKYDEFEDIYKECVSNLYKSVDAELKEKIDNVENQLKQEKENNLRQFFDNYNQDYHFEHIFTFEDMGLNITLSTSETALKKQIVEFFDKVYNDFMAIQNGENAQDVLYEYQHNGFDYVKALNSVNAKLKEIKELEEKLAKKDEIEQVEQTVVQNVETLVSAPVEVVEEQPLECVFKVYATRTQLKELKEYLNTKGIKYE